MLNKQRTAQAALDFLRRQLLGISPDDRLFVALKIPDETRKEIFNHCYALAENPLHYRWEAKEKVHLTLKFIGEVKEELLQQITDELEFVKNYSSFDCLVSRFGFFFRDNEADPLV